MAHRLIGAELTNMPHIQDFFYMKKLICQDTGYVSYMKHDQHKNVKHALKSVSAYQTEWGTKGPGKMPPEERPRPQGSNGYYRNHKKY